MTIDIFGLKNFLRFVNSSAPKQISSPVFESVCVLLRTCVRVCFIVFVGFVVVVLCLFVCLFVCWGYKSSYGKVLFAAQRWVQF